MFFYLKALHIIFVVTWFAGLFYVVRLFIYDREAQDMPQQEKDILHRQYLIMTRRLWYGITWPSCILTIILGSSLLFSYYSSIPGWLWVKLAFIGGLLAYHFSLHYIYRLQSKGDFPFSSTQLRVWNEVATIFLVAITMLVVVRDNMSVVYGLLGIVAFTGVLMAGIRFYKRLRQKE